MEMMSYVLLASGINRSFRMRDYHDRVSGPR